MREYLKDRTGRTYAYTEESGDRKYIFDSITGQRKGYYEKHSDKTYDYVTGQLVGHGDLTASLVNP